MRKKGFARIKLGAHCFMTIDFFLQDKQVHKAQLMQSPNDKTLGIAMIARRTCQLQVGLY